MFLPEIGCRVLPVALPRRASNKRNAAFGILDDRANLDPPQGIPKRASLAVGLNPARVKAVELCLPFLQCVIW